MVDCKHNPEQGDRYINSLQITLCPKVKKFLNFKFKDLHFLNAVLSLFSTDLQTNPVASFMQRRPKKTKAERIKSKALLYGAKEIMKGQRVPSC